MAFRRKRISAEQMDGFVARLMELSIQEADLTSDQMLSLPVLTREKGLTCYDAAYLARARPELANRNNGFGPTKSGDCGGNAGWPQLR